MMGEKRARLVVTGSSGMIGTRLLEKLLANNYRIMGLDRNENKWNLSLNKWTNKIDLLRLNKLDDFPKDIDLIIHLAANARVHTLITDPELALENIVTTFNVLEFARKNNINNIIFSSSREIYGDMFDLYPIAEDNVKLKNCKSPYSASKLCGETLIHAYSNVFGINYVIVRFSNVYGMYDDSDRVIPLWIKQSLNNKDLIIYGKNKVLDFIHIDDAITGMITIINNFEKIMGETFNIASGKGTELVFIASKIRDLIKSENEIIIKENRIGEIETFQSDISKARNLLDYQPTIEVAEGLDKAIKWYKKYYDGCKS